jgi:mannan endo-1,4-beta-mannosidase
MTKGYDEVIALNKPFGFGELGPGTPNGSFDYGLWY